MESERYPPAQRETQQQFSQLSATWWQLKRLACEGTFAIPSALLYSWLQSWLNSWLLWFLRTQSALVSSAGVVGLQRNPNHESIERSDSGCGHLILSEAGDRDNRLHHFYVRRKSCSSQTSQSCTAYTLKKRAALPVCFSKLFSIAHWICFVAKQTHMIIFLVCDDVVQCICFKKCITRISSIYY